MGTKLAAPPWTTGAMRYIAGISQLRRVYSWKALRLRTMTQILMRNRRAAGILLSFSAVLMLSVSNFAAHAQGIESKASVDAIVGSEVEEEEAKTADDADKVIAAIDNTVAAIELIRKTSKLDKVEIVFLTDAAASEGGPPPAIRAKIEEKKAEIIELRGELEGNAMLFHAIDSRGILVQDVLAVVFDGGHSVTIYTASKPAG
jgi:hypothetical protein